MRVVFWIEQYWPSIGGVEVLGTRYASDLRRRGHDVHVVTSHSTMPLADEGEHDGVPIHRFPFYDALARRDAELILRTRARLSRLWSSLRPEIVHLGLVAPSVFFLLQILNAARVPLLVNMQLGALSEQAGREDTVMERTLGAAAWITCVSQAVLDDTRRRVPAVTDRSSVVHNAMDVPDLAPAPLETTEPRLLCLGRIVPVKGFDLALGAMPEILRAHPGTRLLIAGDGPQRPEVEAQARDLGIADVVEFPGWVPPARIPHVMNGATLAVIPSRQESFGLVALEAAMMGRPAVAARVGGLPEVVADGVTGRLVDPENVHALAEAVCSMLAHPDLMIDMGRRARERAMREFTWDRYLDTYERLYRRLLGTGQTRST